MSQGKSAFRAAYSDWRLIKTRQTVQIIFEIPLEDADAAYEVLGGMPQPGSEQWFGIAALSGEAAKPQQEIETPTRPAGVSRNWNDLQPQQQAGIRCSEATFVSFLKEEYPDHWHEAGDEPAECVRMICGVRSRVELGINQKARTVWGRLDGEYQGWLLRERVS
jgi:hypothetical protein